jgi:eukaryotic-like serine/threonine-protein kinase
LLGVEVHMLGATIGRYKIVAKLGEGGMGTVWKAEDALLGRTVALKLLPENMTDSPQARRRFLREARAASSLRHSGIATLYDAGEEAGKLYIASEFVDGETVSDLVARGPLAEPEVVRVGVAVAEALAHAHEKGIVHRDISARNVMIARDGRVLTIDFGLARHDESSGVTATEGAVGTVAYIAPEVVLGGSADHRSDIYSLGVVLYEMVTGLRPFLGENTAAVIFQAIHEKPAPPSARRGVEVSPRLERAILKAMAKKPERRYQSAAELAGDLRAVARRAAMPAVRRTRAAGEAPARQATKRPPSSRLPARKCLAVFPFTPLGTEWGDLRGEDFARGLAETLGAALSRSSRLQVVPPSQVGSEGSEQDLRAVARSLGANLVLSGTVRRSHDRIRVGFTLTDSREGKAIAGDQIEGSAADLFAVEDALLASVIRSLQAEVAAHVRRIGDLASVAAHEKYLTALGYLQPMGKQAPVDEAIKILEGLVATEGDTALVHAALGKAYLSKLHLTRQPELESKAEASCRLALSLDPHSPEALLTLARLRLWTGHRGEAVAALKRCLELQPQRSEALILLSFAYDSEGRFDEAEQAAKRAISLRPDYYIAHERLGHVYFHAGDYGQAIHEWEQVIDLAPGKADSHSNLAAAYFQQGRLEDAEQMYRRAIEMLPTALAYSGLGTVCFFLDRHDEAIALFEKSLALAPRDPHVWLNLGDAQRWISGFKSRSAESFDRAIGLLQEQLETNPQDAEGWSRLAYCLSKRGRVAESLAAIRRAFEIAPANVNCLARAITVYELAGYRERALEYLKAAVESGYGRVELERDPELSDLRREPNASTLLTEGRSIQAGTEVLRERGGE